MSGGNSKPNHGDFLVFDNKEKVIIHCGIYNAKNNTVIHKTGPPGGKKGLDWSSGSEKSEVRSDDFDSMAKLYDSVTVNNRPSEERYPPETVVQRAKDREGETSYNLITDNCITFALECELRRGDEVAKAKDELTNGNAAAN